MTDIDTLQEQVAKLQRMVFAKSGKPGVNVQIGLLRAAKHQLLVAELDAAQNG